MLAIAICSIMKYVYLSCVRFQYIIHPKQQLTPKIKIGDNSPFKEIVFLPQKIIFKHSFYFILIQGRKSQIGLLAQNTYKDLMQEERSLAQMLMPRSAKNTRTLCKEASPAKFCSNIYEIELKKGISSLYQFSLVISPELPANSSVLREKIIKSLIQELKKKIGFLCFKGDMIWGKKELLKPQNLTAEFDKSGSQYKFDVMIKPVKEISIQNFIIENPEQVVAVCQILNINTKNTMRSAKMVELTRGVYYDQKTINENCSRQYGLNVWRGYNITIAPYNNKIYLQVDPCSRVLREQSFLLTLQKERKAISLQEINMKYTGSSVLMRYGNMKVYRIDGLDFKLTPRNTFSLAHEGKDVSYIEYFKQKYGYVIKNEKQPLVRVISKVPKYSTLKDRTDQIIYLVPEMLTLTGLSDAQKSDFRIMKSLDPFTKMTPQKRMQDSSKIINRLRDQEQLMFQVSDEPKQLDGYELRAPQLRLGNNKILQIKNGNINLREKVLEPHTFTDFIFCYSVGKDPAFDQEDADYAFSQLQSASTAFGIKIKQPAWGEVKYPKDFKNWREVLEEQYKKCKPEIVIFFLKPAEESHYAELKRYSTNVLKCPCQIIRRKMFSPNSKGILSVASKVILQMNAKLAHPLWIVPNTHGYWKTNNVKIAIAGIASSKGKKGTNISFVGTTNTDLNGYYCDSKSVRSKEEISTAMFINLFTPWLQTYFMKNQKALPNTLIVFREGLNEVQAKQQFETEIQGLIETIEKVKLKAKVPNYKPIISYILVNKQPNSRIFDRQGRGKNSQYYNPLPGSVIFEDLSKDNGREFHLASVSVNQGSCTPVSFRIAYQNEAIPLEALSELTYNQCYSYYNWTGSVRIPAPLQYANKLAKLASEVGDDLMTQEKNPEIKCQLFFL